MNKIALGSLMSIIKDCQNYRQHVTNRWSTLGMVTRHQQHGRVAMFIRTKIERDNENSVLMLVKAVISIKVPP